PPPSHPPDPMGALLGMPLDDLFAELLVRARARAPEDEQLAGFAELLSARGVPAVIGMSPATLDDFLVVLTSHFYEGLVQGKPIDEALRGARQALLVHRPAWAETGAWATPTLWLCGEGAEWLSLPPAKARAAPEDTTPGRVLENPPDLVYLA